MTQAANLASLGTNANSSGVLSAAGGGTGLSSPGTSGNVLISNGTAWTSGTVSSIPTGSVFLLYQASAPTGWTQVTSLNDYSLRIVSGTGGGTGGTTAFSTVFANQTPTITTSGLSAGATTLSTTQIPSHNHQEYSDSNSSPYNSWWIQGKEYGGGSQGSNNNTGSTGGGSSHSHSLSGSATSSAITLNVLYANVIICSKN